MSSRGQRYGTKWLLVVVIAMGLLFLLSHLLTPRARDRSFREVVIAVDTATVVEIHSTSPASMGRTTRLWRQDGGWRVADSLGQYMADQGKVEAFLANLAPLRSKRYIGTMDMLKDRYELGDSTRGTLTLHLMDGRRQELNVGRATFAPKGVWTYVNVPGEREIIAVGHDLSTSVLRGADAWRVPYLVHGNPERWERLRIRIEDQEPFELLREGTDWTLDGYLLDSTRVQPYLVSMANATPQRYHHGPFDPDQEPVYEMEIHTTGSEIPIRVELRRIGGAYVATSSQFPGNRFVLDPQEELSRLVQPRAAFLVRATAPEDR